MAVVNMNASIGNETGKGKRWGLKSKVRRLYNAHWVWPNSDEMPRNAQAVEAGCCR